MCAERKMSVFTIFLQLLQIHSSGPVEKAEYIDLSGKGIGMSSVLVNVCMYLHVAICSGHRETSGLSETAHSHINWQ